MSKKYIKSTETEKRWEQQIRTRKGGKNFSSSKIVLKFLLSLVGNSCNSSSLFIFTEIRGEREREKETKEREKCREREKGRDAYAIKFLLRNGIEKITLVIMSPPKLYLG